MNVLKFINEMNQIFSGSVCKSFEPSICDECKNRAKKLKELIKKAENIK